MLVLGRLAARNRACQQDAVREGVVPVLVEMMMDGELTTPGAVCCLFRHWVGVVLCTFCSVPPTVQGRREMGGAFQSQQQTVVFALLCPAVCAQGASAAHIACLPFDHVSLWQLPSQRLQGVLFFGYA
jgi:hypothetical protein